jgi:hypothetical protein
MGNVLTMSASQDETNQKLDRTLVVVSKPEEVIDLAGSEDDDFYIAAAVLPCAGKRRRDRREHSTMKRAHKKTADCTGRSTSLPVVFTTDSDRIGVTEDLLPLLNILELKNTRTCSRATEAPHLTLDFALLHIQQKDKWSCGYRNLQMMLSSLLPRFTSDHPYFVGLPQKLVPSKGARPLPSLSDIQEFLERAWEMGFDRRGAEFYSRKIIGKSEWIGAVEVWSILASRNIDSVVVQFMKSRESRGKLGKFVWDYFSNTECRCGGCREACRESVKRLLNLGPSAEQTDTRSCSCPVPPLYLQWKGHSVTVVGVRELPDGSYDLILFDPAKAGENLKQGLSQVLQKSNTPLPAGFTKNSKSLLGIDVQILMTSFGDAVDCLAQRERLNVVTASEAELLAKASSR